MARAEGTVNIEVKGAAQGALEVKTLDKALDRLDAKSRRLSSGQRAAAASTNSLGTSVLKAKKSFDSFDKGVKAAGMGLSKFLGLAIKGAIANFALLSVSLMSVHALFVAGKWLHKAYSWGMTAMAGAAASAAVALGTAAAAIREQQAAMYAFTKGGAGEFISGTNQARNAMRTLQADSQLAGLGVAALNKAYAAMAKSMKSSQIAQSGGLMKNLMDFGAAGQDPAAAADKVGALIEALNNSKTSMSKVKEAAKALGPQMEQALKKAKVTSKKQMKELIMSGELAKAGGVAGQFEAVNSTLIGQAKAFFTQIKGEFADFGQQFLEPAKVAMQKIFRVIRTDLLRVSGSLGEFGKNDFFDGLVTAVEKVSNFFVKLMREWLPKTDGFFRNMGNGWEKFARWFRISKEQLKPFIDGARAIESMFKPVFNAVKDGFVGMMKDFNVHAQDQSATFEEFGERIAGVVEQLFNLLRTMEDIRRKAMPFLNDVLGGLTEVFKMLNSMVGSIGGMFGGSGGGLMALGLIARQMKNTKGGLMAQVPKNTQTMNVTAGTVNLGGPGQAPGGRLSSGATGGAPGVPGGPMMSTGRQVAGGGGAGAPGQARYLGGNQPGYASMWERGLSRFGPRSSTPPDFVGHGGYDRRSNGAIPRRFRDWRMGRQMDRQNAAMSRLVNQLHGGRIGINLPLHGATAGARGDYSPLSQPVNAMDVRGLRATGQIPAGMTNAEYLDRRNAQAAGVGEAQMRAREQQIRRDGGGFNVGRTPRARYQNGNLVRQFGAGVRGFGGRGVTSARGMFGNIMNAANTQVDNAPGFLQSSLTGRQMGIERLHGPTGAIEVLHPKTGNVVAGLDQQSGKFKGATFRNSGFGLKRKLMAHNMRQTRSSRLGSAILGNDEKKIGGINRSMGAKMAVGMGMGMLSQKMAPEAQGAMALGGMVGQFNPLAGLAVGFGGAALKSRTAKGGAATGAMAGAAIGTMIAPGVGTAVGAALGAITGALAGWYGGMKQRAKEAKAAVNSFLDAVSFAEFKKAGIQLKRNEEAAARGESLAGRSGALENVASETAAKYRDVGSRFKGIDMDFQKRNDQKALNFSQSGKVGTKGVLGAITGQSRWGRRLNPLGWATSVAGLATRGVSQLMGGLGNIPGMDTVSKVPGLGFLTGNNAINDDQKKALDQIEYLRKEPAFKGMISDDEYKAIKASPTKGLTEIGKKLPERIEAATMVGDQSTKRMEMLKKMSGKSGAELELLAKKMGVNLYDSTMRMSDMVEKLGLNMVRTTEEMKNLNIDSFVKGISDGFDEAIKAAKAPEIYDERGRQVFDVVKGGGDTASVLEALKGFQESSASMGKGAIDSFYGQKAQIGTAADPGKLFGPGGAWAKMDPAKFFTPAVVKALAAQDASTEKGFIGGASEQITGMLANSGMMGNTSQLSAVISSMDAPNRERFLKDVESGTFNITDPFANKTDAESKKIYEAKGFDSKEEYMQNVLSDKFGAYGATQKNFEIGSIDKDTNAVADKMGTASDTFKTAVENFNDNMASYFTDSAGKPEWWSKEAMKDIMKDDTNTPRGGVVGDTTSSRLSQTMARHNSINGSIAGKRSITSSYRTYGLGSLNSDHVTGRAIDIVGQNLGSYAVATRNAGGFAEFHGSGRGRHLHAVPGAGAIGDTLTPASNQMGVPTSATVSSGTNSFTFHINGGQNNPEEIANMVMAKIKNTEQRVRERT